MLVGRTSYPRLSSLRHLAEIVIPGCYDLTHKFAHPGEIVQWVKTNTSSDPEEMSTLDIMIKFVCGRDRDKYNEQEVRYLLLSNLIWFTEATLPYYYLKIPEVREILKRTIAITLRDELKVRNVYKIDDLVYEELLDSFTQFIRENSCNGQYNPDGGNLTGFLVFSLKNFWGPTKSKEIFEFINSRGMFSEVVGEDFSAMDMNAVSVHIKVDLLEFQDIARSIYRCSREIYNHAGQTIYDLFSRVKAKEGRALVDYLNREISRYDRNKLVGKLPFTDINMWSTDKHEVRNKYTNREELLQHVDSLLVDAASTETLSEMVNALIYVAEAQLQTKAKDAYSIFSAGPGSAKRNYDKVFSIIAATTKLRTMLAYLKEQRINIFSVPSAIFKDHKFQDRNIRSLRQYLEGYEMLMEIISETPPPEPTDNTKLYGELVEKATLSRISSVPLSGLKAILDASRDKAIVNTSKSEETSSQEIRYLENILKYFSVASFYHSKLQRSLRILADVPVYVDKVVLDISKPDGDNFFENAKFTRLMLLFLSAITCFEFALEQGGCLSTNPDGKCNINPENFLSSLDKLMPENFNSAVLRLLEVSSYQDLDVYKEEGRAKVVEVLRAKQTIHLAFMQIISMASLCLYANKNDWSAVSLFKALTTEVIAVGNGSGNLSGYAAPKFRPLSHDPKFDWGVDRGDKINILDYLKLPQSPTTLPQILPIDRHSVALARGQHAVFELFESNPRNPLLCRQTNIIFRLAVGEYLPDKLDRIFENYLAVTKHFGKLFEISKKYVDKFDDIATSMSCSDYDIQEIPEAALEMANILAAVSEAPSKVGIDNRRVNKYGFYLDGGVMRPDKAKSIVGVNLYKHASGHYFYFVDGKAKLWAIY